MTDSISSASEKQPQDGSHEKHSYSYPHDGSNEKHQQTPSHGEEQTTAVTELGNVDTTTPQSVDLSKLDEGAELMLEFEGQLDDVGAEDYSRVLRKIDWHLLPLMLLLYFVQFADKTSLGSASILGIKTDNDLTQDRFNLCSSLFYLTYLAFEYPCSLLLQRFKTGKVLTAAAVSWAVFLLCHIACNNFPGLLTLRLLLGVTEGIVTPGFLMVTSAYYRSDEQATRVGLWFLMNGFAIIFNAMVAYGCQFIDAAGWKPWRWFFLLLGLFGVLVAILYFFFFPDTPAHAWFLTRRERAIALKRVASNQSGSKSQRFKKDQLIEGLKDSKIWLFALYAIFANIPNSVTQQRSILITELGFDTLQSALLNIPTGLLEIICIPAGTLMVAKLKWKRALVMNLWTIPSLVGSAMLIGLPEHKQIARLVGVYLAPLNTTGFVISLSWCSAANAGTTKRVTANALLLIGYCVGNLVGPYIWRSQFSPLNTVPWSVCMVSYFLCVPVAIALHFIMARENTRRDEAQEHEHENSTQGHQVPIALQPTDAEQVDSTTDAKKHPQAHLDTAFLDLTDKQNRYYRYPL